MRYLAAALTLWASLGMTADAWNVTDTGQPFTTAQFTLTEGTWMNVDASPDGRTLLFDLLGDIYSMPAGGGEATAILDGPALQRSPAFSADGRRLLYMSDASGADNVWIANLDGTEPRQITHDVANMMGAPAWGPDDESVVAVKTYAPFPKRNSPELRLFDLLGGDGRVLVESSKNGRDVEEPQLSSDGRFLYYTERISAPTFVYVDANHINYAIQRRELRTGKTETLIGGFGGAVTPRVSPDDKRVAFVRRVKEKTVLFVYDLASGEQRPVYDGLDRDAQASYGQQSAYYPGFAWFPDNRHIAIWGKGKLYRVDADEASASEIPFSARASHRITTAPRVAHDLAPMQVKIRTARQLAPSVDGRSLIFTAVGHLWRKQLPAGKPTRLTRATAFEFEPARTRDGRTLAYVEWDDERGSALKVMPSGGGKSQTVVASSGLIREPSFSPDGKWLVYRINAGDKAIGGFRVKPGFYIVPAAGGKERFVVAGDETPMFSADGARIYFTSLAPGGESTIRRLQSVSLDGFDPREHARTPNVDTTELRLSPDERWIAFRERQQYYVVRRRETGSPMLLSAREDAVPVVRLTDTGGYSLTWSVDSSSLHWTLGETLFRASVEDFFVGARPQSYATLDLTLPSDVPQTTLAFTNARIITMRDEEVIDRGTVVIERNRIVAVGPVDQVTVPRHAKVIDASGKTLMPGFVDMHGHTECCNGVGAVPQKQPTRYAQLAFGVTTNFDPYSTEQLAYESVEAALAGVIVSPRWIPSGAVIYGRPQMADSSYVPIDSYADAQAVMERKRALGGTFIKSYRQPTRRQRQMLIKAAREANVMVDVEGEGQFYVGLSAILDGHTNLEHNFPVANYYDDVVQLMKHASTSNTPTLVVLFGELFGENYMYEIQRAWSDPKIRAYVQEAQASSYSPLNVPSSAPLHARGMTGIHVAPELWDIGFRSVSRSIKKLDDSGVIVHAGSHGQVAGLSLHWEMWLLAEGGMSNHRVLRTATLNGARTLSLDRQIGSLEVGKLADLIVLDGNPLEDIHQTNTVRYTVLNGRLYDSLSMNEVGTGPAGDRPRSRFYWELVPPGPGDWNETWSGQ